MNRDSTATDRADWLPASLLAAGVHAGFALLLLVGVQWRNPPAPQAQAELWNSLPAAIPAEPVLTVSPPVPLPGEAPAPAPPLSPPAPPAPEPTPIAKPAIGEEKRKPAKPVDTKAVADREEADREARQEQALRRLDQAAREKQKQAQADLALRKLDQDLRTDAARQAQTTQRANALASAKDRIAAQIREKAIVPPSVPAKISCQVSFVLLPDGSVLDGSLHVLHGSGVAVYDEAVQRAILAAQPLPMPEDVSLRRELRDIRLTFQNEH